MDTVSPQKKGLLKHWWQRPFTTELLLCILAGISFGLAFTPLAHADNLLRQSNELYSQTLLAFLGLSLWLWIIPGYHGKKTALLTGLFALSSYIVATSWVYISIHIYGQTASWLAFGLTALFVIALAVIQALPWFFYPKLAGKSNLQIYQHPIRAAFSLALCWLIAEFLLTYIGTGFPWLLPGYIINLGVLRQAWLPLIGIHGWDFLLLTTLSLLITSIRIILYGRHMHKNDKPKHVSLLFLITAFMVILLLTVGLTLAKKSWTKPISKTIHLRLVQGAIPQNMKWNPNYLLPILDNYNRLSEKAKPGSIIIWPEGAIPAAQTEVQPFIDYLQHITKERNVSFVLGIPLVQDQQFYNAALAIDENGQQTYRKRHLVPFGEYLPLEKQLRGFINFFNIPMSDFSAGEHHQQALNLQGINIGTLICYEVAYPGLVGESANNNNVLLAISDDTWFGRSAAAWQQLQISKVRSAETQLPMILVGNDGYTGWIDARGHVRVLLPRYEQGTLVLDLTPRQGITPITWFYQHIWP